MRTALGDAALNPVMVEVVFVAAERGLVRLYQLGSLPTNLITLTDREVTNSFATDVRDMTADMMVKEHGFPALLNLAEAPDATI